MTVRKTIRIFGVSLALIALLVFATGVVSDWHHSDSTNDAHCPYCHLGHQTPIQPEAPLWVGVLKPVAALPVLEEVVAATAPVFSQIAPRAPPSASTRRSPHSQPDALTEGLVQRTRPFFYWGGDTRPPTDYVFP